MLTVACVLKSGGAYGPEDVAKLARGVSRHLRQEHTFVCLSDLPVQDAVHLPLKHDWPTWWAKVELWRPGLFTGPVFYLDLDSIVLSDLGPMIAQGADLLTSDVADLVMLRDARHPQLLGSGILYWHGNTPSLHSVYERFALDPQYYIHKFRQMPMLGDQALLQTAIPAEDITVWPAGWTGCLNVEDEAVCRTATVAYCSWVPKLKELATEDSWRGEIVRAHWV